MWLNAVGPGEFHVDVLGDHYIDNFGSWNYVLTLVLSYSWRCLLYLKKRRSFYIHNHLGTYFYLHKILIGY